MSTNRRTFLASTIAGAAALAAGCASSLRSASASDPRAGATGRRRVLRIAHVTDTHIMPERNAEEGVRAMWRQLAAEKDLPDFVITGGDHIMHAMDQLASRVTELWNLWHAAYDQECPFATYPVLGNHDVWGWHAASESTRDAAFGKKWGMDSLRMRERFYRIDHWYPGPGLSTLPDGSRGRAGRCYRMDSREPFGGLPPTAPWRILVLDSIQPHPERTYQGFIDPEQMEWLRAELAVTPADHFVLIATHIPIISATVTMNRRVYEQGGRKSDIDARDMHADAGALIALFDQHPQVRACISGHLHQLERLEYAGPSGRPVTYLCNGAASGAWWRGTNINATQAYTLLDLHSDGTIDRTVVPFPFTQREPDDMPPRRST